MTANVASVVPPPVGGVQDQVTFRCGMPRVDMPAQSGHQDVMQAPSACRQSGHQDATHAPFPFQSGHQEVRHAASAIGPTAAVRLVISCGCVMAVAAEELVVPAGLGPVGALRADGETTGVVDDAGALIGRGERPPPTLVIVLAEPLVVPVTPEDCELICGLEDTPPLPPGSPALAAITPCATAPESTLRPARYIGFEASSPPSHTRSTRPRANCLSSVYIRRPLV